MDHLLNILIGLAILVACGIVSDILLKAAAWLAAKENGVSVAFNMATVCTLSGMVCFMLPIDGDLHQDIGGTLMMLGGPVMTLVVGYYILRYSYRMLVRLPRRVVAGTKVVLTIAMTVSFLWLIGAFFRSVE